MVAAVEGRGLTGRFNRPASGEPESTGRINRSIRDDDRSRLASSVPDLPQTPLFPRCFLVVACLAVNGGEELKRVAV